MAIKKLVSVCAFSGLLLGQTSPLIPVGDYHQHLFSPDVAAFITANPTSTAPPAVFESISAAATGGNLEPREGWASFRTLPLSEAEFRTIANNVPPYMR